MIIRKIKAVINKTLFSIKNMIRYIKVYFFEDNIFIGDKIHIGENVTLKTTDGGKIVIGDNVSIEANSFIYAQKGEIRIGENGFIGIGSQIVAKNSIMIGSDSLISAYSVIRDANHSIERNSLINSQGHTIKEIVIEDDVWLGAHSVVTAGCHIGKGAVVGANAVVTKDVKSYTVVGGVPATFIKERT